MGKRNSDSEKGGAEKIEITVVVNGQSADLSANINEPLLAVRDQALAKTHNVGQSPDNWELKDKDGNVLDINQKIKDFDFGEKVTLFLSLKAGVAGA
jgi:hypothetical protein